MIVAYLLYVFSWIWEEMYQQQLYNGEKQQGKPYLLIFNPTYWLRYKLLHKTYTLNKKHLFISTSLCIFSDIYIIESKLISVTCR